MAGPALQAGAFALAAQPGRASVVRLAGLIVLPRYLFFPHPHAENLPGMVGSSLRAVSAFHGHVFSSRPIHLWRDSRPRNGGRVLTEVPRERVAGRRVARSAFTSAARGAPAATPAALSLQHAQQHRRADSQ